MTTPQAASDALDYLDDMTGVRELDIPGGRSPVAFLSRYGELIRALLTAAAQPAQDIKYPPDSISLIEWEGRHPKGMGLVCDETVRGEQSQGIRYQRIAQPATDTTGEGDISKALTMADMRNEDVAELDFGNVFWAVGILASAYRALLSKPAAGTTHRLIDLEKVEGMRKPCPYKQPHPQYDCDLYLDWKMAQVHNAALDAVIALVKGEK